MIDLLIGFVIFLFVLSVHECAHAWMADRSGDPTARLAGRMTLSPLSHIDPIGTVLIPLSPLIFGALSGGGAGFPGGFRLFGWARPVPVNPANVRRWRTDNMLISLAGPASGLILALAAAAALRVMLLSGLVRLDLMTPVVGILWRLGAISILISLFNLIPIPPLDGYHIVTHLLGADPSRSASFIQMSGPWILLFLINTPLLSMIIGPLYGLFFGDMFRAIAGAWV